MFSKLLRLMKASSVDTERSDRPNEGIDLEFRDCGAATTKTKGAPGGFIMEASVPPNIWWGVH